MTFTLRPLVAGDVDECGAILAELDDWFGIEEANAAYVEHLRSHPGGVAEDGNGRVAGFLGLRSHGEGSVEIEVMGVRTELHRAGIGRRLVDWAVERCRTDGVRWLHVKTRGPSTWDEPYERTRRFYRSCGFSPLYESRTEWGPDDAALIMVMALD